MPVKVVFTAPFYRLTSAKEEVYVEGGTVLEVLSSLEESFVGIKDLLLSNDRLKPDFTILINDKDISQLDGLNTLLKSGDEVVLMPLVAGG